MKRKIVALFTAVMMLFSVMSVLTFAESVKLGDVDRNDKVTSADARKVLRVAASLETLDETQMLIADVDGNSRITAGDARKILRCSARLEELGEITIEGATDEIVTDEPTSEEPSTEEPTTEKPTTEVPSKGVIVEEYPEVITSLFNKEFYMKASTGDGENSQLEIAMDGVDKLELAMSMDSLNMSLYMNKDKLYIKFYHNNKPYCLTMDALQEYMSNLTGEEINFEEEFNVEEIISEIDFGSIDDYLYVVFYTEEFNGTEYDVYSFIAEDGSELCFYVDDAENIKAINEKDAEGKLTSTFEVDILTSADNAPSKMLTTKGFDKDGAAGAFVLAMFSAAS